MMNDASGTEIMQQLASAKVNRKSLAVTLIIVGVFKVKVELLATCDELNREPIVLQLDMSMLICTQK